MNIRSVFVVLLSFQTMFALVNGDSVNSIPGAATETVSTDRPWSQPIAALLAAGTGVTSTLTTGQQTRELVFSSFNTSGVTATAVITGIIAQVFHSASSGTTIKLNSISWNTTTLDATPKSNSGNIPTGSSTTMTFGTPSDKWGTTVASFADLSTLKFVVTYNFPGAGGPQTDITNFGLAIQIHFIVPTTGTTAIITTGTTALRTTGTTAIITTGTTAIKTTGTTARVTTGTTARLTTGTTAVRTTGTTARIFTTGTTSKITGTTTVSGIATTQGGIEGNGIQSPPTADSPVGIIVGATIGGIVLLAIVVGVAIFVKVQIKYKSNREAMRHWGSSADLTQPEQQSEPEKQEPQQPL